MQLPRYMGIETLIPITKSAIPSTLLQLPRYMGIETRHYLCQIPHTLLLQLPRYMGIETQPPFVNLDRQNSIATSSLYGD